MLVMVIFILVFIDNYIWCLYNGSQVVVVDLGDVVLVLVFCEKNSLIFLVIFIIYYYWDYIGGIIVFVEVIDDLLVIGLCGGYISGIIKLVVQGDMVKLFVVGCEFLVIEVLGYMLDYIVFYGYNVLFCGDMLFVVGCGCLFEGILG